MDCIEARALKSSFLSQMALNSNSPVFYNDDVWFLTGAAAAATVTVEDFPVEDLLNLDLPEMEFQDALEDDDFSQKENSNFPSSSSSSFSGADEFDCLSAGEIAVPVEGLENLEWLSQFVHDYSSSEHSLLCPAGGYSAKLPTKSANRVDPVPKPKAPVLFLLTIPRKPRTLKTTRPRSSPWMLPSTLPPAAADSSSTTSSCNGSSSTIPPVLFANPVHDMDWFSSVEKPPVKRQKRKLEAETGRRCTHCQVQKTPQWRTGPLGPKTLCNACGVRFKSGRLFPEYRPACSPSFSQEVHSNSHRKVLEMRRMKEEVVVGAEEAPPPVLSQSVSALG